VERRFGRAACVSEEWADVDLDGMEKVEVEGEEPEA
jgi:hypothetical protein